VYQVVGIVGSLRVGSYNRALLRAAIELQPACLEVVEAPIGEIPLFNQDVEDAGLPPAVCALREAITQCDGVLIFCPEYNSGIPGVLKNALDWASRSHEGVRVLLEKPVAIVGASPGGYGTTRSQLAMRALLPVLGMRLMPKPDVAISRVGTLVDENNNLLDEKARESIQNHLLAFGKWIDTFSRACEGSSTGRDPRGG
jgi:chromate reductase